MLCYHHLSVSVLSVEFLFVSSADVDFSTNLRKTSHGLHWAHHLPPASPALRCRPTVELLRLQRVQLQRVLQHHGEAVRQQAGPHGSSTQDR